ncbi:MAG: serine hydrolase, partial [Hyphomonadaceae bacterium]
FSGEHDPATLWRLLSLSTANAQAPLGQFQYTNEGYNIATIMTDRKLGIRWQDLLQREVFGPADMTRASAYMSRAKAQGVVATPYLASMPEGPTRAYLEKTDQTMQSAGGVVMSAHDGARWIELMVEDGRIGGRQIIPAAAVQMVREQQVSVTAEFDGYQRDGYALGWYLGPHRDEALMHHFGGFAGARAHVSFIPARHIGVTAFVNDSTGAAPIVDAIANYVYDRSASRADADAKFEEAIAAVVALVERGRSRVAADRAARADRQWTLTRPHADYAGRYLSDALGAIDIAVSGQEIEVRAGVMHAIATPFTQPDSIRVELAPGQGWAIAFDMGDAGPTALSIMGERFLRT